MSSPLKLWSPNQQPETWTCCLLFARNGDLGRQEVIGTKYSIAVGEMDGVISEYVRYLEHSTPVSASVKRYVDPPVDNPFNAFDGCICC